MHAVLQDAIDCFQKQQPGTKTRRAQRLAREAEEWFFSDDTDWPFSFLNICAALGIEPGYVRLGLKRWRQYPPTERRRKKRLTVPTRGPLRVAA